MKFYEDVSRKHSLAKEYASIAHDDVGQIRKGSGDRYWTHPFAVSDLLESYGASEEICIACCLHDTLEDTEVTYENLAHTFGEHVAELVVEVSNIDTDLEKASSKEEYMNRKIVHMTQDALSIKLGDILANTVDYPRKQQVERMMKNIEYLKKRRKLNRLNTDLLEAVEVAFESTMRKIA